MKFSQIKSVLLIVSTALLSLNAAAQQLPFPYPSPSGNPTLPPFITPALQPTLPTLPTQPSIPTTLPTFTLPALPQPGDILPRCNFPDPVETCKERAIDLLGQLELNCLPRLSTDLNVAHYNCAIEDLGNFDVSCDIDFSNTNMSCHFDNEAQAFVLQTYISQDRWKVETEWHSLFAKACSDGACHVESKDPENPENNWAFDYNYLDSEFKGHCEGGTHSEYGVTRWRVDCRGSLAGSLSVNYMGAFDFEIPLELLGEEFRLTAGAFVSGSLDFSRESSLSYCATPTYGVDISLIPCCQRKSRLSGFLRATNADTGLPGEDEEGTTLSAGGCFLY